MQSAIRGRTPDPEKPQLADFDIQLDTGSKPRQVTCPGGQKVSVRPSSKQKSYVACFELPPCQECPLFRAGKCLAQPGKQNDKRLRLRFTQAEAQASQRRRRSEESKRQSGNLRAAVEASVRSLKLHFPGGKLPVRGKFRVTCMLIGSAAMANVRRIQRYLQAMLREEMRQNKVSDLQDCAPDTLAPSFLESAQTSLARFLRFRPIFSPIFAVYNRLFA